MIRTTVGVTIGSAAAELPRAPDAACGTEFLTLTGGSYND